MSGGGGVYSYDRECYRRGGSCGCGGGVCGKQASATPPSPSIAPAGHAWLLLESTEAMVHAAEDLPAPRMFGKVWRAMAGAAISAPSTAPEAWVYECKQPHTDPVIWSEFFSRDKPSDAPYIRNARPLYGAALASRPAEVDDEGLPPLPLEAARASKGQVAFFVKWSETGKALRGELLLFTAEQYRRASAMRWWRIGRGANDNR